MVLDASNMLIQSKMQKKYIIVSVLLQ